MAIPIADQIRVNHNPAGPKNAEAKPAQSRSRLSPNDRLRARQVSDNLEEAFCWELTPQGHEYWSEVFHNLRRLAEK